MTDPIGVTGVLVTAHKEGKLGNVGEESWTAKKVGNLTNSPLEAFAVVASFFAGQQSQTMADTLVRYKDKHKEYKDTLELSEAAHVLKSEAAAADGKGDSPPTADKAFRDGMDKVLTGTGKKFSDIVEKKDKKYEVGEDQAQTCIDAISQKKDILSTELQAISTDMDMAVKDSGEAESMAANAVSNLTDLLGTLGKQAGG